MFEKELDTQLHTASPLRLVKTRDALTRDNSDGCRYRLPHAPEKSIESLEGRIKSKLLSNIESSTGTSYVVNAFSAFSPRWQALIQYLKDQRVLEDIFFRPQFNDAPPLHCISAGLCIDQSTTDGNMPNEKYLGHALSDDPEEALSKTIGESLERYVALIYRRRDLIHASLQDVRASGVGFLDPVLLAGFSEAQKQKYPNRRFDEKSEFVWAEGRSLLTDKKALIPAQLLFWTYRPEEREPVLRERNTNGAGGYFNETGAVLSGIYESVQRDGLLMFWFNRAAPKKIDHASIPDARIQHLLKEAREFGFDVSFLDVTTDVGIPAVFCGIRDASGYGPRVFFGAGCGADPLEVLHRSYTEAWGSYRGARQQLPSDFSLPQDYVPFSDERVGHWERLLIWQTPEMDQHIAFFFSGNTESFDDFQAHGASVKNREQELRWAVERVVRCGQGYEPFAYAFRHPILDEVGYHIAKVVVPQLVPLHLREQHAAVGARRIFEAPERIGARRQEVLNSWPQPLP